MGEEPGSSPNLTYIAVIMEFTMMRELYIAYYRAKRIQYHKTHRTTDAIHYKNPCIGYVVEGSAEYICDGKKYSVSKGDLVYIPKGSKCISIWKGDPDIVFYSVNFDYLCDEDMQRIDFQIVKGIEDNHFSSMALLMEEHCMKSLGHFYMLLDDLVPLLKKNEYKRTSAVRFAVEYLEENYMSKISTEDLARMCNLSVSSFYAHFKDEMGCTPVEYKNNLLVQKAADLLLHHGLTVAETAEQLGFSSTTYFSRLFKKFTGKLPRELKQ